MFTLSRVKPSTLILRLRRARVWYLTLSRIGIITLNHSLMTLVVFHRNKTTPALLGVRIRTPKTSTKKIIMAVIYIRGAIFAADMEVSKKLKKMISAYANMLLFQGRSLKRT